MKLLETKVTVISTTMADSLSALMVERFNRAIEKAVADVIASNEYRGVNFTYTIDVDCR